jgi:hypothetical protein
VAGGGHVSELAEVSPRPLRLQVWIRPEQIVDEGILLSRHQASDHYIARLTQVLAQLLGTAATWEPAEEDGRAAGTPQTARSPA